MKRIARLNRLVEKRDNNKMNQKDFNKKFIEIVGEENVCKMFWTEFDREDYSFFEDNDVEPIK